MNPVWVMSTRMTLCLRSASGSSESFAKTNNYLASSPRLPRSHTDTALSPLIRTKSM